MCQIPTVPAIATYAELRAEGWTRRGIDAALAVDRLTRVRRGVYARDDACADAVDAARHGGALACVSAARHLNLWVLAPEDIHHVWMRHGHRYRHDSCMPRSVDAPSPSPASGCIEHWDEGPIHDSFGLPSVPRLLLQIFHCQSEEVFFTTLESARRQRRITAAGLSWLRARLGIGGRRIIDFSRASSESGLESILRWRLRVHDLDVQTQASIFGVGRVDFLIGGRLIVEVDGELGHEDAHSRHKDLMRDALAAVWGLDSLRFDYAMVIHDWELVEAAILQRLALLGLAAS